MDAGIYDIDVAIYNHNPDAFSRPGVSAFITAVCLTVAEAGRIDAVILCQC